MVHKCAFTDQGVPSGLPLWRPQAATAVLEGSIVILEGVTLVLIDKEVGGWGGGLRPCFHLWLWVRFSQLNFSHFKPDSLQAEAGGFYRVWAECQRVSVWPALPFRDYSIRNVDKDDYILDGKW